MKEQQPRFRPYPGLGYVHPDSVVRGVEIWQGTLVLPDDSELRVEGTAHFAPVLANNASRAAQRVHKELVRIHEEQGGDRYELKFIRKLEEPKPIPGCPGKTVSMEFLDRMVTPSFGDHKVVFGRSEKLGRIKLVKGEHHIQLKLQGNGSHGGMRPR